MNRCVPDFIDAIIGIDDLDIFDDLFDNKYRQIRLLYQIVSPYCDNISNIEYLDSDNIFSLNINVEFKTKKICNEVLSFADTILINSANNLDININTKNKSILFNIIELQE